MIPFAIIQFTFSVMLMVSVTRLHFLEGRITSHSARIIMFIALLLFHGLYFLVYTEVWFVEPAFLSMVWHSFHIAQALRFVVDPHNNFSDIIGSTRHTMVIWSHYFLKIVHCRGFIHIDSIVMLVLVAFLYFVSQKSNTGNYVISYLSSRNV
jgi:hypothetical protein